MLSILEQIQRPDVTHQPPLALVFIYWRQNVEVNQHRKH